jgi:hypothetical protein
MSDVRIGDVRRSREIAQFADSTMREIAQFADSTMLT